METKLLRKSCGLVILSMLIIQILPAQVNRIINICWERVERFPIELLPIKIPVGCEVIDCCPGCPGPPIDWRIRISREPNIRFNLRFENMPAGSIKNLSLKGKGRKLENGFTIQNGETIISGFSSDNKSRPAIVIPEIQLDEANMQQMQKDADADTSRKGDKNPDDIEFSVDQMIGDYIINQYKVRYVFRRCYWPPPYRTDSIVLVNNTSNDNAVVLLDGRRSGGCVNDEVNRGSGTINVHNVLTNGACNSEVAILSDDNAMELITPVNSWTDATGNRLTVNMRPMLVAPVSVWIMIGGAATLTRAQNDIANANLLYNTNNAGISFNATFNDVSANPAAATVITNGFGCLTAEITALTGSAFFTPGRLNVYYINRAFTGFNCIAVRNISFIGTTSNNQSLAHEFGHSFSLGHTNGLAGFSAQNLMIGGGAGRTNITDGQSFRSNINPTSTVNTNGVRTGITRTCADGTTSTTCPALNLDVSPK